jgi:hypothetical protein
LCFDCWSILYYIIFWRAYLKMYVHSCHCWILRVFVIHCSLTTNTIRLSGKCRYLLVYVKRSAPYQVKKNITSLNAVLSLITLHLEPKYVGDCVIYNTGCLKCILLMLYKQWGVYVLPEHFSNLLVMSTCILFSRLLKLLIYIKFIVQEITVRRI